MDEGPIVVWFSCGTSSAVAAHLTLETYGASRVRVARCVVPEEDADNDRFSLDVEQWLGAPITLLRSRRYESCEDVWSRERYMAGPGGARCTIEMKKAVRWDFEREVGPSAQVFGFHAKEKHRADRFRDQNPEVKLLTL